MAKKKKHYIKKNISGGKKKSKNGTEYGFLWWILQQKEKTELPW